MKRFISLILILALAMMPASTAFADTIKLPSSLKTIDKEAFLDNSSIEEVVVPYGAETIGERAFAGSGIVRIYVPATVTAIADNAFEGADDVIIYAPSGSHAQEYAEAHDYLWQDAGSTYQYDKFQETQDIYNNLEEDDASLDHLSWDTIDLGDEELSEEAQQLIDAYNSASEELSLMTEEYALSLNSLYDQIAAIDAISESSSIEYTDDGLSYSSEGFSYNISNAGLEELGSDMEVISTQPSEDGDGLVIEVRSGGNTYLVRSDENGLSIIGTEKTAGAASADSYMVASVEIKPYLSSSEGSNALFVDVKQQVEQYIDPLELLGDVIDSSLDKAEEISNKAFERYQTLDNLLHNPGKISEAGMKTLSSNHLLAEANYKAAIKVTNALRKAASLLKVINPFATLAEIGDNISKWNEIGSIYDHDHPLPTERNDPEKAATIDTMLSNCRAARIGYFTSAANNALDLIDEITTVIAIVASLTGAAAPAAAIAKSAVFVGLKGSRAVLSRILAGFCLDAVNSNLYDIIMDADRSLHGLVSGYVTDSITGEPVKRAMVTCNDKTVYTDSKGYYEACVSDGTHTVIFTKSRYIQKEETLTMSGSASGTLDVEMVPKAELAGTVRNAKTLNPIAGATVDFGWYRTTTDENGHYHFDLAPATETLKVTKEGYKDYEIEATCEKFMTKTYDVLLEVDCELLSGEYQVVLTWNSSLFMIAGGYESNTGRIALTYNINPSGRYSLVVEGIGQTSQNPYNTEMAASNPVVTIYKDSTVVATFKMPSKGGCIWYVFDINNGVLTENGFVEAV